MGDFIYILLCAFLGLKDFFVVSFSSRNIIFIKIVMKETSLKKKATRLRVMRMWSEPAKKSASRTCTGGGPDSGVHGLGLDLGSVTH